MEQLELFPEKEKEVTYRDLYEEAVRFCEESWGVKFTGGIELVKRRWKRRLGAYYSQKSTIRMSSVCLREMEREETYDTLRHELVHWYLHTIGQPHSDIDFEFIAECLRLGVVLSGARKAQEAYELYCKQTKRG